MTRAEFLQGLKTELEGRVPYSMIQENIRYYDSYILDEVNKGADEAEVIESLGGPKIIARTIVDAALDTEDGQTVMRLTDLVKHRKRMPVLETGNTAGPMELWTEKIVMVTTTGEMYIMWISANGM